MAPLFFELKNAVAFISLNRPDKLNAFNRDMSLQLLDALEKCRDENVRCVYITGSGKAFSAGQDLAEVTEGGVEVMKKILREQFNPIVTQIKKLEKPVVAAVNGVAAGAGANIALCCDIVVAARSASFIQAFSKIGLIPDSGGTHTLPRLIGWQKASALMMLGEKVSADEAQKMGMIYKVFDDEHFAEESKKIAFTLAVMPTKGLAYTKQVLALSVSHTLEEQLQQEDLFQQQAAQTDDYREGVSAFLEKRAPVFQGK